MYQKTTARTRYNGFHKGGLKVRRERTLFRDKELDNVLSRHHIHSYDFLVSEYNLGKSCGIINYVHKGDDRAYTPDSVLVNYCKMRKDDLPYFTVEYDYKFEKDVDYLYGFHMDQYIVHPHNKAAEAFLERTKGPEFRVTGTLIMDEEEFISFLYELRGTKETSKYYDEAIEDAGKPVYFEEKKKLCNIGSIEPKTLISLRHRTFKYDVPCVDIDCIIAHNNVPTAFIEFKRRESFDIQWNFAAKAIADLGNGCDPVLPVYLCCYNTKENWYQFHDAYNEEASDFKGMTLNEKEFFAALGK